MRIPHVAGYPILSDPYMFKIPIQTPGHNHSTLQPESSYLSFAPPEVIGIPKILLVIWLLFCFTRGFLFETELLQASARTEMVSFGILLYM